MRKIIDGIAGPNLDDKCLGKCGKRVNNRSGYCTSCSPPKFCKCGREIKKMKDARNKCKFCVLKKKPYHVEEHVVSIGKY